MSRALDSRGLYDNRMAQSELSAVRNSADLCFPAGPGALSFASLAPLSGQLQEGINPF